MYDLSGGQRCPAVHGKAIHVGQTRGFRKLGLAAADLGDEGYAIYVQHEDLFLEGGRRRGPINAVLALLEEDLGCRWLPGDVNVVPRRPELSVRPVPRPFRSQAGGPRAVLLGLALPALVAAQPHQFDARTHPGRVGRIHLWALRTHSHLLLVPPAKYLQDHPEYYGQKAHSTERDPHVLCLTNPDLLPIAVEAVRAILRKIRGQGDHDREGGRRPPRLLLPALHGDLRGRAIAAGHAPDVRQRHRRRAGKGISRTYCSATMPIPTRSRRPRRCGLGRTWGSASATTTATSCPSPACRSRHVPAAFAGWKAITDNLFIYDYWENPSHPMAPQPNLPMIARNIRWFTAHGVREVSGLGTATWFPHGDRTEMRTWVTAKLLWNPAWDLDYLVRDFCLHYYGQAGPLLVDYENLLRASLKKHEAAMRRPPGGRRYSMSFPLYSQEFLDQAADLLERATKLADNETIRQRNAQVQRISPSSSTHRRRNTHERPNRNMCSRGPRHAPAALHRSRGRSRYTDRVKIQVDPESVVGRIAPDFMGLGYETSAVAQTELLQRNERRTGPALPQLESARLDSYRRHHFGPRQVVPDGPPTVQTMKGVTVINKASLENLGASRGLGLEGHVGLNLGTGSKAEAVEEALAVDAALGTSLHSFQIGNEVEGLRMVTRRITPTIWITRRAFGRCCRRPPFSGPDAIGNWE